MGRGYPLGLAADLRVFSKEPIGAHQHEDADDSFASDRADFDAAAILHVRHDRNHPAFGKIGMPHRSIWFVVTCRTGSSTRFNMRPQGFKLNRETFRQQHPAFIEQCGSADGGAIVSESNLNGRPTAKR